ncbi:MAG: NnrS family protein [Rhodospirillales bacterium]|jgi:uncharacterized protein involved in response to NO|nr:NnrS family protein [Rhodospirillales bacterium]
MILAHPLWSAAFRPFFLLGGVLAPLMLLYSFPGLHGDRFLWHGHEMLFGLAGGICTGFILTALPSWGGAPAISRPRLALLFGVWLLGRLLAFAAGWLPPLVVALGDLALFPLLAAFTLPDASRMRQKGFLALAPILLALFLGNALFHFGLMRESDTIARHGLHLGLAGNIGLFGLVWGFLAPTFTRTALQERGQDHRLGAPVWLEWASHLSLLAFLLSGLLLPDGVAAGMIALAAALIHLARFLCWKFWRIVHIPIVSFLQLAYLWLVAVFALRAGADLWGWPPGLWIHAFTTGGLGMMMVAMLTRVSQRHTGRPFRTGAPYLLMGVLVTSGAGLRLAAVVSEQPQNLLILAAILWGSVFPIFLLQSGSFLTSPSLPKE